MGEKKKGPEMMCSSPTNKEDRRWTSADEAFCTGRWQLAVRWQYAGSRYPGKKLLAAFVTNWPVGLFAYHVGPLAIRVSHRAQPDQAN